MRSHNESTIDVIGRLFINGIKNALNNNEGYPAASIHGQTGYPQVILLSDAYHEEEILGKAEEINQAFDNLIKSCNLTVSSHPEDQPWVAVTIPRLPAEDRRPLIKVTLNMSHEDAHQLLMEFSHAYAGYHNQGSLLRLAHPELQLYKPDTICLFPVLIVPESENEIMPRIAGCNASETLSVQLSHFIAEAMPELVELRSDLFGHHISPLLERVLPSIDQFNLINLAHKALGIQTNHCHQTIAGDQSYIIDPSVVANCITPITEDAMNLYSEVSAVMPDELPQLQSAEVPLSDFITLLRETLLEKQAKNTEQSAKTPEIMKQVEESYRNSFKNAYKKLLEFQLEMANHQLEIPEEVSTFNGTLDKLLKIKSNGTGAYAELCQEMISKCSSLIWDTCRDIQSLRVVDSNKAKFYEAIDPHQYIENSPVNSWDLKHLERCAEEETRINTSLETLEKLETHLQAQHHAGNSPRP